jgi:ABC-type molybdate transport system ATPase subunit
VHARAGQFAIFGKSGAGSRRVRPAASLSEHAENPLFLLDASAAARSASERCLKQAKRRIGPDGASEKSYAWED